MNLHSVPLLDIVKGHVENLGDVIELVSEKYSGHSTSCVVWVNESVDEVSDGGDSDDIEMVEENDSSSNTETDDRVVDETEWGEEVVDGCDEATHECVLEDVEVEES